MTTQRSVHILAGRMQAASCIHAAITQARAQNDHQTATALLAILQTMMG
jgi:hypothetical protein